ncbi:hypothetical protein BUALT_Bualt04G0121700 [Buddleja alternifolia]|uniref:Pentatricopeptide repeat-containing protein n=1 Tax=Buddleja alternifolia TaxID=168488 RepID=A0AAV6XNA0_9LAMI|nr:hypothetical protein BUALT_Bualt04G0121700 [Buddleja alternifolia]
MYVLSWSFADAQLLFDKMPQRNVVSYNVLISAYSRSPHDAHVAFGLFDRLENEGLSPNGLTSTSLLQASAGLENLVMGCSLHGQCVKMGFLNNVRVQTSLLGMYSNRGDVECAKRAFCSMIDKDAIAWNSIISGYVKNGKLMESPELFHTMLREKVNPTRFTYSLVLNACAKLEGYDGGKLVHAQVLLLGTYIDLPLQNALLDMYCSCGDTHTAYKVFLRIENPDLVTWNIIIDEYTFAAVISGTSGVPSCDYGKPLHAQTEKTGHSKSVYIGSTLISMYVNNDDYISSQKIFSSFLHKDAVLWTEDCNLDSYTLSSALSACADLVTLRQGEMIHLACSHCGLVDKCRFFWNYMKENGLKPGSKHYSCMISLLSRFGLWEEAEKMIIESPFVDDYVESWRAILSSCIRSGNVGVGICAAENILNVNAEDNGASVLLMKVYAAAGIWDDVSETRRKMRKLMVEKEPGLSWIEVRNDVHVFCSGDQSHGQNGDVRPELSKLMGNFIPIVDEEVT